MKKREKWTNLYPLVILSVFVLWMPHWAGAQTPVIITAASQSTIQPNEIFTIILGVDSAADAYYFGVEVEFDPEVFEFVSATETGLMTGGISIADLLANNRVGASVTRTTPLASSASGDLLALTFRVIQTAPVGLSDFTFPETELYDSEGSPVEIVDPGVLSQEVAEGVSDLRLTIPAVNQIAEGEELSVSGSVYVNDITLDEALESGRVTVWVGLNTADSDPSTWGESVWVPMEFDTQQDSYHLYQQNVGFQVDPGIYYIALRAQLDVQNYEYGGQSATGGGLWDGIENTNAQLAITENPPFRYVLAGWNFDNETLLASSAVPANEDLPFQLLGASEDGFTSGASGQAASSTGWQFTEGDEKYWLAVLSTQGFRAITVSSRQYSTGAGPRDFQLEVSLDSLNWEPVSEDEDTIRVATNWTSGVVDDLSLSTTYEDQSVIYLRWIRRGDIRADDTEGITTGKNRIDDVFIRGENINPFEVTVWPGDTDNNGLVDELDVLPLGQYWLSQGPPPVYPGIAWVARTVEAWIPEEGTYADANADGIVNYRDLLPVGLNFGETTGSPKPLSAPVTPLAELSLRALEAGERLLVSIETENPVNLTGISYRFRLEHIAPSSWNLRESATGAWATDWVEADKLLTFQKHEAELSRASATFVHQGKTKAKSATRLAEFQIEATQDWNREARLVLERVVVAENRSLQSLESVMLVPGDAVSGGPSGPELPKEVQLRQNYPNPFNPTTVISYSLPADGQASMVLYDMLGREVATLFNGPQKAGTYDFRFDGSNLSSGIYIYRLKAEGKVLTRMLTLIK